MLRIGQIAYANCTPIFYGLRELVLGMEYSFVSGVPTQLNGMLAAGKIDVCPSSSIEYALHSDRYMILPDLSISSIGAVGSVLLFSRIPIEDLDGQQILLSTESATSVNLLRVLINRRLGSTCSFSVSSLPLQMALEKAPAALLIGDSALRAADSGDSTYVYDLGKLWHEWTGLPFVFALWICNKQAIEDRSDEVKCLAGNLISAKKYAEANLEQIARKSPELTWMGAEKLVSYWRDNISYDLSPLHLEGLALFYRYCVELGLLNTLPEFHFLDNSSRCGA